MASIEAKYNKTVVPKPSAASIENQHFCSNKNVITIGFLHTHVHGHRNLHTAIHKY